MFCSCFHCIRDSCLLQLSDLRQGKHSELSKFELSLQSGTMRAAAIHKISVRDVAKVFRSSSLPLPFAGCRCYSFRTFDPLAKAHRPIEKQVRSLTTHPISMASFSNTDTGSKPADPYKQKNLHEPELKEKIEDLVKFMDHCKFGMMTTRIASSGLLTSRCMALAAKVRPSAASTALAITSL